MKVADDDDDIHAHNQNVSPAGANRKQIDRKKENKFDISRWKLQKYCLAAIALLIEANLPLMKFNRAISNQHWKLESVDNEYVAFAGHWVNYFAMASGGIEKRQCWMRPAINKIDNIQREISELLTRYKWSSSKTVAKSHLMLLPRKPAFFNYFQIKWHIHKRCGNNYERRIIFAIKIIALHFERGSFFAAL